MITKVAKTLWGEKHREMVPYSRTLHRLYITKGFTSYRKKKAEKKTWTRRIPTTREKFLFLYKSMWNFFTSTPIATVYWKPSVIAR